MARLWDRLWRFSGISQVSGENFTCLKLKWCLCTAARVCRSKTYIWYARRRCKYHICVKRRMSAVIQNPLFLKDCAVFHQLKNLFLQTFEQWACTWWQEYSTMSCSDASGSAIRTAGKHFIHLHKKNHYFLIFFQPKSWIFFISQSWKKTKNVCRQWWLI